MHLNIRMCDFVPRHLAQQLHMIFKVSFGYGLS
ncbi:hypothetical protein T4D_14344 [Trichinella pseudospiralis]|uniref:Uncharacterized protein n=1 Tax=Trichinella pseudospiralis TaxID=6337 RepID=A0A0V1C4D9_TRIPS|nr:hypothetical protein T4D_14344 [Trichinella pseudospiralis]